MLMTASIHANRNTLTKVKRMLRKTNVYEKYHSVSVSNSGRYFSVLRAEDGAQWLDVLFVSELLRRRHEQKLIRIDPYPYSIKTIGWRRSGLVFETDAYVLFRNPLHQKAILKLHRPFRFVYNPNKRKIFSNKKILTAPLWYYAKVLSNQHRPHRKLALSQLLKIYLILKYRHGKYSENWQSLTSGIFHPPHGPLKYLKRIQKRTDNRSHKQDLYYGIRLFGLMIKKW